MYRADATEHGSPIELRPPAGFVADADAATPVAPVGASIGSDIIELQGASRSIGDRQILAPTDLAVRSGELLIVSGRSGSGKTTLLGLLAGFGTPSEGVVVRHDGGRVAVGTSSPGFAETMTVRQNIVLACSVRGLSADAHLVASIDDSLGAVGLLELADRPVSTLSGGERQRVSIVRAISSGAELVLLDEPTSQLDQGLARRVSRFLLRFARAGHAIVCASHEPELITAADRVHSLS
jgi:putative ABC transport system ATP-binding protein